MYLAIAPNKTNQKWHICFICLISVRGTKVMVWCWANIEPTTAAPSLPPRQLLTSIVPPSTHLFCQRLDADDVDNSDFRAHANLCRVLQVLDHLFGQHVRECERACSVWAACRDSEMRRETTRFGSCKCLCCSSHESPTEIECHKFSTRRRHVRARRRANGPWNTDGKGPPS